VIPSLLWCLAQERVDGLCGRVKGGTRAMQSDPRRACSFPLKFLKSSVGQVMGKKAQQKFRRKLKGRDPPELPSSILEEVADANSKTEDRLSRGTLK